jgi:hypothetical protein
LKASRAKKLLQKKAIEKEKKKAEAEASGIDWLSDDSDDEPQVICLVLSTFTYSTIFFNDNVLTRFCVYCIPETKHRISLVQSSQR